MSNRSNPLEAEKRTPEELRRYFSAAAGFWMEAVNFQERRCESKHDEPRSFAIDVCFYAVAIQRLREVARMAAGKLRLASAQAALDSFDQRWPRFKHLRNILEHIVPAVSDPDSGHYGIAFFPGSIVHLRPGGEVDYLIDVRDAKPYIEKLYADLIEAIAGSTKAP